MEEIADEFVQKYFSDLVAYHKSLFGLHKEAQLTDINYISIYEDFFAFINFLRQIDDNFENEFLDIFLADIVKLLHFIDAMGKDEKSALSFITTNLSKFKDVGSDNHQLYEHFSKEFKLHKTILIALLNTKLFYLDRYIWHKINHSLELRQLLKIKNIAHINCTHEYLKHARQNKTFMVIDYSSFHIDQHNKYAQEDIDFVKSLVSDNSTNDNSLATEQLIRYKNHIPYFNDIDDQDIRNIITDVKFLHYKDHEIVIKEFDVGNEIFFMIDGECRVSLHQRALGTIKAKSIFGEFSFITKQPRSATVKTNKDSIVISFCFDLEAFDKNPCLFSQLYKNISEELVKKIYHMNKEHLSI